MSFPHPPTLFNRRDLRLSELDQPESLLLTYGWMVLARIGDNRILDLFRQGLIRGTVTGGQGNEALVVPLALLADKAIDVVSFSHRGFGGHLIWSGHLGEHLCQYFANSGSPTRAREGNIHHGDPKNRSLPMISHLGIMLSNVIGSTDSQRRLGRPAVGFTFFGDGASSTGDIHESLNLAAVLSVPVIFIIENNKYAYSTPVSEQFVSPTLHERAKGYGMEGFAMDCTDPAHVLKTLGNAIERVRQTRAPLLIEAHTFRLRGHAAYDTCDYMKPGEAEAILAEDPLPKFRAQLVAAGHSPKLDAIDAEVRDFIEATIKTAIALPPINVAEVTTGLFAPPAAPMPWQPRPAAAESLTMAQALNHGLRKILTERPESIVIGQDIGNYGGAF
ncbi:MAG: thiamine pyrophosphate-dependent enzyme, partial [Lacunisphaera sp.]